MKKVGLFAAALLAWTAGVKTSAASARLHPTQGLVYNLGSEPKTLDPSLSMAVNEATVIVNTFEGLLRPGAGDVPQPGVAKSWEVSGDGLTYTFHLRGDARWSNGNPVTAQDFEFSWKRALEPALEAEYAYQLYYLKNGEAYHTRQITDPEQIGVKARDDRTLVVTLEGPCAYFLSLCYFPTLFPLHRKAVSDGAGKWALDPRTYLGNGPFRLARWIHGERMELEPNPYYWNRKAVRLRRLTFAMFDDPARSLTMYQSRRIDLLADSGIPRPVFTHLQASGALKVNPYLGVYYYLFNTTRPPLDDPKVRRALTLAIDRTEIVERITRAGERPALAFVPDGIPDAAPGRSFRRVGGAFFQDADTATARKLLAEAGYPGGQGFPSIEILYNTHALHQQIAEAIQGMWKKALNVSSTLAQQEWSVYLSTRRRLAYPAVCRAGWIGDYVDPMTFVDMWSTESGSNDTGWSNPQYDRLVRTAKMSGDPHVRMKAMHDAEAILMSEMPVAPLYFYTRPLLARPWVKDVNQSALGFFDFSKAYVAAH